MPQKRNRLDITQHEKIGDALRSLEAEIRRLQSEIQAVYPKDASGPFTAFTKNDTGE